MLTIAKSRRIPLFYVLYAMQRHVVRAIPVLSGRLNNLIGEETIKQERASEKRHLVSAQIEKCESAANGYVKWKRNGA